jgi:hypothetical protein
VDADVQFLMDPEVIWKEFEGADIGLTPHLNPGSFEYAGIYNTGTILFRNTDVGRSCLDYWSSCVLDPNNPDKEYGGFGYQVYANLFPTKYPGHTAEIGTTCLYGAHWNYMNFDYSGYDREDPQVSYRGRRMPLAFWHFSQFGFNEEKFTPTDNYFIDGKMLAIPAVRSIFQVYHRCCRSSLKKLLVVA